MKIILNEWQFKRLTKVLKMINENISKEEIDLKASEAKPENASEAQIKAGNYKKGHFSVRGFDITIENPVGSRRYYGKDKKKYNVMKNHYGYFTKTKGKDGDQVDVFIGPDIEKFEKVYVVDQKINGKFDESKVMFGFLTKKEAKAAYFENFNENWHGFMHITGVSLATFKKWLYRGRKQRQPFADYVEIQKKKLNEQRERELKDIEGDLSWETVRNKSGKMNLKNRETGEYLSPEWFEWVGNMNDGVSLVRNSDGNFNYLKNDGSLLLPEWCYDCEEFGEGDKARIVIDTKEGKLFNVINRNGKIQGRWEKIPKQTNNKLFAA